MAVTIRMALDFFSFQLAVRDVGDREVLEDLAALQREIADPVGLMRRLLRCVGESRYGGQQCDKRNGARDCEHCCLPVRFLCGRA
jgi:hypothetical protein